MVEALFRLCPHSRTQYASIYVPEVLFYSPIISRIVSATSSALGLLK